MPQSFFSYNSTTLAAGAIKQVQNFGTLFACESIKKGDGSANVGGISLRVDGGTWAPWVANRGFRFDNGRHTIEIKNTALVPLTVGYYYGEADMFTIT